MDELRLGDVIDDHCIKCRRLTNHSIVSMVGTEVAKVRCRSCYHEHSYLHEQAPPSKKDLKKAEMLAAMNNADPAESTSAEPGPEAEPDTDTDAQPDATAEDGPDAEAAPAGTARSVRGRAKKA